jgi:hypothetical protein
MKKPLLLTSLLCVWYMFSYAQEDTVLVRTGVKGLFIEHKIAAKENFYSLGRTFSVHPKYLAAYNKLDMSKGLTIGQTINIPLSDTNLNRFSAGGIPVYYKSLAKQTAGSISAISKTQAGNIRKWNNLLDDNIPAGKPVIIGYLISSSDLAGSAADNSNSVVSDTKANTEAKKDTAKQQPANQDTSNSKAVMNPETIKKEPTEQRKEDLPKKNEAVKAGSATDGYFKEYFALQIKKYPLSKDQTVTSGIFKTKSGWNDGKYYALIDGIEPGTVIKVINPTNSKAIYAKVLGQMNGIPQNLGLSLRISNAAASVLDITETDKFIVKVSY